MSNNEEQLTEARKLALENLIDLGAMSRRHVTMGLAMANEITKRVLGEDDSHLQVMLADAVMLIVAQRRELEQRHAAGRETAVTA